LRHKAAASLVSWAGLIEEEDDAMGQRIFWMRSRRGET